MGAQFWRVGPSKNRSGGRLRTATARKTNKNRFRDRLRTHFLAPGLVFCRFWAPGRTPKLPKNRPRKVNAYFWSTLFRFLLRFLRSGVFRKGPGPILRAPGALLDQILIGFSDILRSVPPGSCRGLSGSAGMLPGYTLNLRNSLCGFPLGYGDLAQRFKYETKLYPFFSMFFQCLFSKSSEAPCLRACT